MASLQLPVKCYKLPAFFIGCIGTLIWRIGKRRESYRVSLYFVDISELCIIFYFHEVLQMQNFSIDKFKLWKLKKVSSKNYLKCVCKLYVHWRTVIVTSIRSLSCQSYTGVSIWADLWPEFGHSSWGLARIRTSKTALFGRSQCSWHYI